MIYFLRSGPSGPVKIGYAADNVWSPRVKALQGGNPVPLVLARTMPGRLVERAILHRHYAALSLATPTWFRWCDTMLTIDPAAMEVGERHGTILRRLGGAAPVARHFGLPLADVRAWIDADDIPSRAWVELIRMSEAQAQGVTLGVLASKFARGAILRGEPDPGAPPGA